MRALVNWILSSCLNGGILFSSCTLTSACTAPTGMSCTKHAWGGQVASATEVASHIPMALCRNFHTAVVVGILRVRQLSRRLHDQLTRWCASMPVCLAA